MPSIATTTAVPIAALDELRAAAAPTRTFLGRKDAFPSALARHGRALEVFEHSGHLLAGVLMFLHDARGIDLGHSRHDSVAAAITSARGSRFILLAEEHRPLAGKLTGADITPEELAAFRHSLGHAGGGPEVGEAMREGIRFLGRALDAVTPGTVVLLAIL